MQFVQALAGHGYADDTRGVFEHKADGLRRNELSGDNEVALVLAPLVIDNNDEAALTELIDSLVHGSQGGAGGPFGAAVLVDGLYQGDLLPEIGARLRRVPVLYLRPLALSLREELIHVAGDYIALQVYTIARFLTS